MNSHMYAAFGLLVRPEHFARMSAACVEMNRILETWPKWVGCVNHWGTMSEFFKNVKEQHKITKRCLGIGMRGTSVADVWDNYPRIGRDKVFDCVNHVLGESSELQP